MNMMRWTRWWLTVIVVGGVSLQIVNAANETRPQRAHFKSVPKLNKDGTRDIDLPTVRRRGSDAASDWFLLNMLVSLFGGAQQGDFSGIDAGLTAPQFDMDDYNAPQQSSGRQREGTLDRVTNGAGQNSSFGSMRSK